MTPTTVEHSAHSAATLAAATPARRDRYLDLLRVGSIASVVLGHWLMLTVQKSDGRIKAGNVLALFPAAQLLTWVFQVMPIFFLVGGAAHAFALRTPRRYPDFVASRLRRLLMPTTVFLGVWVVVAIGTELAGIQDAGGVVQLAARTVVQPLWFLGVYLGMVGLAPAMYAAHRRWGVAVPVALVLAVATVDAIRLLGGIQAVGALNVAFVWLAAHQLGFLYADGRLTRQIGLLLTGAGLVTNVLLTIVLGWYPVSMVGLPGSPISNMSPPTLALAAHACWLAGLVILVREPVTRWLTRPRVWTVVVAANGVVMTVFLWHLTALFLVAAGWVAVAGNHPLPTPGGADWWATRPLWLISLMLVLGSMIAVMRRFEQPSVRTAARHRSRPTVLDGIGAGIGVALAAVGLLVVSLTGLSGLLSEHQARLVGVPVTALAGLACLSVGWGLVLATRR